MVECPLCATWPISIVTKSLTPCGVAPPCFAISGHLAGLPQAQELRKARDQVWLFTVSPSTEHRAWCRCSGSLRHFTEGSLMQHQLPDPGPSEWLTPWWFQSRTSWVGPAFTLAQSSSTSQLLLRGLLPGLPCSPGPSAALRWCWLWCWPLLLPNTASTATGARLPQSHLRPQPSLLQFGKYVCHSVRIFHLPDNQQFIRMLHTTQTVLFQGPYLQFLYFSKGKKFCCS